jgi:HEAT repeat protein
LGGAEVSHALLSLLETTQDAEEKEALVRALGEIGDPAALPPLLRELEAAPPRPLLLALFRAIGELDGNAALPLLRKKLVALGDDPVLIPALADVLARMGDVESLSPLLSRLQNLESPIARKQSAAAIGKILGEGEAVYSLLSQEGFGREEAVSKTLQELIKQLRALSPESEADILLERYVGGDFAGFMQALRELFAGSPDVLRANPFGRFVESAIRLPEPRAEETILTIVALRGLLAN